MADKDNAYIPTHQEENKIYELMYEWMPHYSQLMENSVKIMIPQKQDFPFLFFGLPGKGKSNLEMLTGVFFSRVLRKEFGLKNRFDLRYMSWQGNSYMRKFEGPAKDFMTKGESDDVVDKWKGKIFALDEAADINSLENMSTFNIGMNKIFATVRGLQLIYPMCIDSPTKLLPDIRQYRVSMGHYVFISKQKMVFDDGIERNVRQVAIYGRREWVRISTEENKDFRVALSLPSKFINRYKFYKIESIPLYPDTPLRRTYSQMKNTNMGKILWDIIQKVENKTTGNVISISTLAKLLNMENYQQQLMILAMSGEIPHQNYKVPVKWFFNLLDELGVDRNRLSEYEFIIDYEPHYKGLENKNMQYLEDAAVKLKNKAWIVVRYPRKKEYL